MFQQLKKLKEVELYPACYGEYLVIALAENIPNLKVIWFGEWSFHLFLMKLLRFMSIPVLVLRTSS